MSKAKPTEKLEDSIHYRFGYCVQFIPMLLDEIDNAEKGYPPDQSLRERALKFYEDNKMRHDKALAKVLKDKESKDGS